MRRQIVGSTRAGESITRVAERLLDIDDPVVRLPRHVQELRDAARFALHTGDRNLYHEEVARWKKRVQKLGQGPTARAAGPHSIRSATQDMVRRLGKVRSAEQVDHLVDRWVLERARHQQRLVARHESVEGFRDSYRQSTERKEYVKGYRWVLSSAHAKPDECDAYAGQDLHGLGPGGYPVDQLPATPHPRCLCSQVAITDTRHFARKRAQLRGEPEPPKPWESGRTERPDQWLRRKSKRFQMEMLGSTRFDAFKRGDQVLDELGKPLPVYVVTGQPKPVRKPGPPVKAKPAIRRDRANIVEPFPRVPPAPR